MSDLDETRPLRALLLERHSPGTLSFIAVRPERGAPMRVLDHVRLIEARGLEGDRASVRSGGKRQVSIMQAEHLEVIAKLVALGTVAPELLRRNLMVTGFSVLSLRAATFSIGDTVLRGVGTCDPCSKMERALGRGGYNAVRGHGGILAQVIEGGMIRLGDRVDFYVQK